MATSRAQSRKHRGYATQRALANRWRENGLAPYAKPPGAGENGADLLDGPPGIAVEIKARDTVSWPAALKQARANAQIGDIPIVVARHNGQGESTMDDWTVTMSLRDFEELYRKGSQ